MLVSRPIFSAPPESDYGFPALGFPPSVAQPVRASAEAAVTASQVLIEVVGLDGGHFFLQHVIA
ncbi:hypothetical protein ADK57_33455 [Streptomyces sp. MMG1533]|uniref:hypothetical protein n=1 Tax=Streptomyces sp. MMG1533 TaxID=1415546 RepID=UPI0006AE50FA|nr:hypothetical protein [Streptomyces sp. MMG1533]KOU59468.1 hypothetical protein ADK57_33455 [Streptomyces sp. MMG1533]